jgi:gluconate kinase
MDYMYKIREFFNISKLRSRVVFDVEASSGWMVHTSYSVVDGRTSQDSLKIVKCSSGKKGYKKILCKLRGV